MPLVKALQSELGTARAHDLVRGSLGAMETLVEVCSARNSIETEERETSPTMRAVDVVGCRYAEFFHQLGEPDLGFVLVCSDDLVASPR